MADKEKDIIEEEVDEVEEQENKDENADDDSAKEKEKTFSQSDVDRMMAREKKQGVRSVLKRLGITKLDEKTEKKIKDFLESEKSDAQKQAEAAVKENTELEEANKRALTAEIKAEAMQAGAQVQYVDDIVTLIFAKVDNEEGLDASTAISELKTKYPVWFTTKETDDDNKKKKVGDKGTGSSVSTKKTKSEDGEKNIGTRLAANRRKASGKKSYWSK